MACILLTKIPIKKITLQAKKNILLNRTMIYIKIKILV